MDYKVAVFEHRERVGVKMSNIGRELFSRSRHHDNSMLSSNEQSVFENEIDNLIGSIPGSSTFDKLKETCAPAWGHHYEFNDHHPEHFQNGIDGMNMIQLIEFLCDIMSHCEKTGTDVFNTLEKLKGIYHISDQLYQVLINTVEEINFINR